MENAEFHFFGRHMFINDVKNGSWAEIQVQTNAHTVQGKDL